MSKQQQLELDAILRQGPSRPRGRRPDVAGAIQSSDGTGPGGRRRPAETDDDWRRRGHRGDHPGHGRRQRDPLFPLRRLCHRIGGDIGAPGNEILLSDALRLAGRAAIANVPVALEVPPGVPHVFQGFAAVLDEADAALHQAAAFLKKQWAATQPARAARSASRMSGMPPRIFLAFVKVTGDKETNAPHRREDSQLAEFATGRIGLWRRSGDVLTSVTKVGAEIRISELPA